MIRVLLVNEFRLMSNVVASVLEDEEDITVVGVATTCAEALSQAAEVDLLLVSTRLPDNGALHLTQTVMERELPVKVLILGMVDSELEILQYVEAGAVGYVLQDDSVDKLLRSIRAAANNEALVSPDIAAALMGRVNELSQMFAQTTAKTGRNVEFTPREEEILALIDRGYTNRDIADELFIEVGTVKNHVHNILEKLNVSSRHEAAAYKAVLDR